MDDKLTPPGGSYAPHRCVICGRTFEIGQHFFNYGHGEVVHLACRFHDEKERNT